MKAYGIAVISGDGIGMGVIPKNVKTMQTAQQANGTSIRWQHGLSSALRNSVFVASNLFADVLTNLGGAIRSKILEPGEKKMKLTTPLTDEIVERLHAGDRIEITGTIFVARDAAHKRMVEALDRGEKLPTDLTGQVVYYMGPSPTKPGKVIGSAGPTTSGRMDRYAPRLMEIGLKGMIGKGLRAAPVKDAMKKHKAVYFAATGGAAALIAQRIKKAQVIAYEELGAEALQKLEVENFPVIVVNDIYGGDAYEDGKKQWARKVQ